MVVQLVMLRKEVLPSLRKIQYWKPGLGLVAAVGASFWVAALPLGSFFSLALSAVLFFLAYGLILLLLKEQLVCEVLGQMLGKLRRKK